MQERLGDPRDDRWSARLDRIWQADQSEKRKQVRTPHRSDTAGDLDCEPRIESCGCVRSWQSGCPGAGWAACTAGTATLVSSSQSSRVESSRQRLATSSSVTTVSGTAVSGDQRSIVALEASRAPPRTMRGPSPHNETSTMFLCHSASTRAATASWFSTVIPNSCTSAHRISPCWPLSPSSSHGRDQLYRLGCSAPLIERAYDGTVVRWGGVRSCSAVPPACWVTGCCTR